MRKLSTALHKLLGDALYLGGALKDGGDGPFDLNRDSPVMIVTHLWGNCICYLPSKDKIEKLRKRVAHTTPDIWEELETSTGDGWKSGSYSWLLYVYNVNII